MYSKSRLSLKWLQYYFLASNSRGHGVHSPFVYELIREVLNDRKYYNAYEKIETLKNGLLKDKRSIQVNDFGAGAGIRGTSLKNVSDITRHEVSTRKFGRLLFRLANFYSAKTIVEMGSSLGISTSYLAAANTGPSVHTMEGSSGIAEIAKENFHKLGMSNISIFTGQFENGLTDLIASNPPADLVFIDGNHRKKPVLEYFEKFLDNISPAALIIIHDIHWSHEMEEAWAIIQADPRVKMSIDIFSAGLVFFRDEFKVKQQFVIRF